MEKVKRCLLVCVNNLHEPIEIPFGTEYIVGRSPLTKISDTRCSKRQVSLIVNSSLYEVEARQNGHNKSGINGLAMEKDKLYKLKHGDRLELLLGQYVHLIQFDPPPSKREEETPEGSESKRKADVTNEHESIKRKREMSTEAEDRVIVNGSSGIAKPSSEDMWETIDGGKLIIFTSKGVEGRSKIASYDLDGTIILTQSGRVFPKDINDWRIAFAEVPGKLKQLHRDGYKIVIFTNQAGIHRGTLKVNDFKTKITRIFTKLGVPAQVFVSSGLGLYRKPCIEMWNTLIEKKNDKIIVDMDGSFYCGDAAGREENWAPKKKKDFSCSDRLFALNVGLKFLTPEEHFLGQKAVPFKLPNFRPSELGKNIPLYEPSDADLLSKTCEVVILVGSPGSGKSFFVKNHLLPAGYVHANRDTLKSWQRCVSVAETAIQSKKSVVIDNTNPDRESRQKFIEVAKKYNVPCRCFVMNTSLEHAKHNNKFREFTDTTHEPVSEVIINSYKSKYQEPQLSEGFSSILKVNFVPMFKNREEEKLYRMYLLEK